MANEKRLVWDLPLRLFHWLLVISIFLSWLSSEGGFDWRPQHFYIGYFTIGLLIFRVIWGFVGPRHARFINFFPMPGKLIRYMLGMLKGENVHTVGHNPAGSVMVFIMLALLAVQLGTGMVATDDIVWSGPYNPSVTSAMAREMTLLHGANFNWILIAIAIHILAVLFYRIVKKQRLPEAMITGKKPAQDVPESEVIAGSQLLKAVIVIAISAAIVFAILYFAPPPPSYDYY